jgi:hypothetical protein
LLIKRVFVEIVPVNSISGIKFELLTAFLQRTSTDNLPYTAPDGTFAVITELLLLTTVAITPPNVTVFSDGIGLKLDPLIVTIVPTAPLSGVKLEMVTCDVAVFEPRIARRIKVARAICFINGILNLQR